MAPFGTHLGLHIEKSKDRPGKKSSKCEQNGLCVFVLGGISKKAGLSIIQYVKNNTQVSR